MNLESVKTYEGHHDVAFADHRTEAVTGIDAFFRGTLMTVDKKRRVAFCGCIFSQGVLAAVRAVGELRLCFWPLSAFMGQLRRAASGFSGRRMHCRGLGNAGVVLRIPAFAQS